MDIKIVNNFSSIKKAHWQNLQTNGNPFLRYEFLDQLERSRCVCDQTGWLPHHITLYDNEPGKNSSLIGAVPLYLKTHSYGEYVFDWAWANALERTGQQYYPKLVVSVPFTPVTGPRLLVAKNKDQNLVQKILISAACELADHLKVSSLHWLFTTKKELGLLTSKDFLERTGCQFHWNNNNYRNFDDFLASFTSKKRKKILQERRYVREAGITMETLTGKNITEKHWRQFYHFYRSTIDAHFSTAYLNFDFFQGLGRSMADDIVLVLAHRDHNIIAGALNFKGDDALFGRYWGCTEKHNGLHFEACYYSAIEYCIETNIQRFEAGAQGEHKLSRGFIPVPTYSAHWLAHPEFSSAIDDFLKRESHGIEHYMSELSEHNPYK